MSYEQMNLKCVLGGCYFSSLYIKANSTGKVLRMDWWEEYRKTVEVAGIGCLYFRSWSSGSCVAIYGSPSVQLEFFSLMFSTLD